MTDQFTELVNDTGVVSVGDQVLVKLESTATGLPSGEIAGSVKEKVTLNGKNYLVVSGFGSVEVPAKKGKVSIKVYRAASAAAPAAAPAGDGGEEETEGGKRRRGKSRRGVRKSRKSTRRRRA
jgi:hypothetical protein